MLKAAAAVIVSALMAGAITGFPKLVEPVEAGAAVNTAFSPAPACPQRGWPYNHCGDANKGLNGARLVGLDRLN